MRTPVQHAASPQENRHSGSGETTWVVAYTTVDSAKTRLAVFKGADALALARARQFYDWLCGQWEEVAWPDVWRNERQEVLSSTCCMNELAAEEATAPLSPVESTIVTSLREQLDVANARIRELEGQVVWVFSEEEVPQFVQGNAGRHELTEPLTAATATAMAQTLHSLRRRVMRLDEPSPPAVQASSLSEEEWKGIDALMRRDRERDALVERLLGQPRFFDPLTQLVRLGYLLVFLAEFSLNRLELLAQEVLPLRLGHLLFHAALNLAAQFEDLELLTQEAGGTLEPVF
jgi:hypothetical protein